MESILWFFGVIINGLIWGCVTQKVIDNKGYDDNWFWWGFFFGLFAVIVACTKPQNTYTPPTEPSIYDRYMANTAKKAEQPIISNTWRCSCGRINPHYIGTCVCGTSQQEIKAKEKAQKKAEQEKNNQTHRENEQLTNLKLLKEYKELLDVGVITQEEFDKKKADLL